MPKVVLVHGWLSTPNQHWFPWLKKQLKAFGFKVYAPVMPNPVKPKRPKWVTKLERTLNGKDPHETILIGHSLGTATILYAMQEHRGPRYEHVILVGSFGRRIPRLDEVTEGYEMQLDLERIRRKAKHWTLIHGDHDPLVPFKEGRWLARQLKATFIVEKNRGHLIQYEGIIKLESALQALVSGALSTR